MPRQKATNYFSHDSNARNDEKLVRLRMKHGAAGYGVYFMLLERLREEADYMSVKDYNMLAFDLRVDASLVKSVVEDFGLFAFSDDGKCFYSDSFNRRMFTKDKTRKLLSEAGKRGNEKRWETGTKQSDDDVCLNKQSKRKKDIAIPASDDDYLDKFFSVNSQLLEKLLMDFHLSPNDKERLRQVAEEVVNEWKISETIHADYHDWSSHLISTMRIKLQKDEKNNSVDKKEAQVKAGREEYQRIIEEQSRKRDEMYRTSVSYEDAKNSEEYRRALAEA